MHYLLYCIITRIICSLFPWRILVGAPKANVTDASTPSHLQRVSSPGAVYKCPFSSNFNDCTLVRIDQSGMKLFYLQFSLSSFQFHLNFFENVCFTIKYWCNILTLIDKMFLGCYIQLISIINELVITISYTWITILILEKLWDILSFLTWKFSILA